MAGPFDVALSDADVRHVLLIEDSLVHARLFQEALTLAPLGRFRVHHATSLKQGLSALDEHYFDIIVSDLGLPDASGLAAVPAIVDAAPRTPLVVMTGNTDLATNLQAIEQGAVDYVRKGSDITDVARILLQTIERHRLNERLERRTEDVRAFTYGLTHDLKSPLISIEWSTHELRSLVEKHPDRDQLLAVVDRIRHAVHTADAFIQEILLFARADTVLVLLRPVDPDEVIRHVLEDEEARWRRRDIRLKVVSMSGATILADINTFPHLVANLVQNAVKFAPEGGTVEIHLKNLDDDRIRLEVHDDGPGVDPRDRERIFHLFERAGAAVRGSEGHGVGLSIVRRIAERHGFEVEVEKSHLGGACFAVTMPVAPEGHAAAVAQHGRSREGEGVWRPMPREEMGSWT